jgi:hypothetical protein
LNTINLSFSSDKLRLIELNRDKTIVFIDELEYNIKLDEDFSIYSGNDVIISDLSDKITRMLGNTGKKITNAGILIETRQTFLNTIPVDFNEDKSSINSHILWELSNYYPESYKNFNIKYYRLNNSHINDNIDEVLLIAIDKKRIEFIKKVCKESELNVNIIDIDHFATERCIKEIYPEQNNGNIFLIGCKENRIDFSLLISGKLKYFDFTLLNNKKIANIILTQLKFLHSYFSDINLAEVLIYGDGNAKHVKKYFDESGKFNSHYVNPFQTQKESPEYISFMQKFSGDESSLSKFAPVYGLALKNYPQSVPL